MNSLGLSPEAVAARRKYVQAGDAAKIMAGEWNAVWRVKMGLAEDPELYDILPFFVQRNVSREQMELKRLMGLFSEPLNLAYCQKQTGRPIEYFSGSTMLRIVWDELTGSRKPQARGDELQVSKTYPWMACNLDGMTTTARGHRCVIDAKHVGRADDPMILRYTAAGTHQATVMGTDWWALSVFIGNGKWELIEQEVDPLYQASLIATTREFWGFVERGEEPTDRTPPGLPPKPQPKLRIVQLDDEFRDAWPNWAGDVLPEIRRFAETDGAAKINGMARDRIKKLLPDDVGTLTRGLFRLNRTKAGAVAMTMKKEADDAP